MKRFLEFIKKNLMILFVLLVSCCIYFYGLLSFLKIKFVMPTSAIAIITCMWILFERNIANGRNKKILKFILLLALLFDILFIMLLLNYRG